MIAFVCEWCKEKALYSTRREQNPNPSLRPMDHFWAMVSPRLEKDDTWRHVCDKLDCIQKELRHAAAIKIYERPAVQPKG